MNKQRRNRIAEALELISQARDILEEVKDEEQESYENLPESLQYGERGEQMQENVDSLEEFMQHIQENVCTHFGTNMDILQNKFDENTWNAYYEGKIEPFAIQLSLVMTNMSFTERERACGNAIFFSANRLQYASNATKLSVSTQLFDRALLNRNGVMDIWNMAHVEDGEKYYIRKEYTEVSELHKGSEQPVIIQQVTQQTEPAAGEEPQNGQEEKEGVNNAS